MSNRLRLAFFVLFIWIGFFLLLFISVLPKKNSNELQTHSGIAKLIHKVIPQQWSLFVPAPSHRKTWRVFFERNKVVTDTVFTSMNLIGDKKLYLAGLSHLAHVQYLKENEGVSRRIQKDSWYSFYAFRHFASYYLGKNTKIVRTQFLLEKVSGEKTLIEEWGE